MICRLAIALGVLCCVSDWNNDRTCLAQACQKKEAACKTAASVVPSAQQWEEDILESEAGRKASSRSSLLERTGIDTLVERNDVAMFIVSAQEPASGRALSSVQISLDTGVGFEERSKYKQEAEKEGLSCKTDFAAFETNESRRTEWQGTGRVDVLFGQPTLDSHHASLQGGTHDGEPGRTVGDPSTTSVAATTGSLSCCHDGRRIQNARKSAGSSEDGYGSVRAAKSEAGGVGKEAESCSTQQAAFPLAYSQAQPSHWSGHCSSRQDCEVGHRVEEADVECLRQNETPWPDVPRMQEAAGQYIPREGPRTQAGQDGHASRIGVPSERNGWCDIGGGARRWRSCATAAEHGLIPDCGEYGCAGDFRRRGSRDDPGWRSTRNEGGWPSNSAQVLPCINIAEQSGDFSPQSQDGSQGMKLDRYDGQNVLFPENCFGHVSPGSDGYASLLCHVVSGDESTDDKAQVACTGQSGEIDEKACFLEYERSYEVVCAHLEQDFSWSRSKDVQSLVAVKGKCCRVSFNEDVQITVFHGRKSCTFWKGLDGCKEDLRKCWSLLGNSSSFELCRWVLGPDSVHSSQSVPVASTNNNELHYQCQINNPPVRHSDNTLQGLWSSIARLSDEVRRVRRIQTWLLVEGRLETCDFHRSVSLLPCMKTEDFEMACRARWFDLIDPSPIAWYQVKGEGHQDKIILVQNQARMMNVHLIHWDSWPVLGKHRAVLFDEGLSVSQVLTRAHVTVPRSQRGAQFQMSFDHDGRWDNLRHNDLVQVESAVVLLASYWQVPADDTESAPDSDNSTEVPSDTEDLFSLTMMTLAHAHYDDRGPFPWEIAENMDVENEVETEEEGEPISFDQDNRFQMMQHAQFLRAGYVDPPDHWVAVTYGVGLTDLGRRDIEFQWQNIDSLHDAIQGLWHDHQGYGQASLFFVTPQPENQHVRPYLVFLVVIAYGQDVRPDDRWVLVREGSPEGARVAQRPYGALLYTSSTPRSIMAQLGHRECFPFGVHDCQVRMAGTWIGQYTACDFRNGALCDAFIGPYPAHIEAASERVEDVESLFKVARAHFENRPESTVMTFRVHGVSPQNHPLGSRDIHFDYPDLANLDWVQEVLQLWPFRTEFARCVYIARGDIEDDFDIDQPILHLIVSYAVDPEGVPVLIKQRIHPVEGAADVVELWATVVPRLADDEVIRHALDRQPFWFHPDARTHILRDGRTFGEVEADLSMGAMLELKVNVISPEYMLSALWAMSRREGLPPDAPRDLEQEQASLLQIGLKISIDTVEAADSGPSFALLHDHQAAAFHEICAACIRYGTGQEFVEEGGVAKPAPACSEGNLDLRTAAGATDKCLVAISLEHTLVDTDSTLDESQQMIQVFEVESWKQVLSTPWVDPFDWLPEGMHVHRSAWEALHDQFPHGIGEAERIELYIDGATSDSMAGWSIVVISHTSKGQCCQGVVAGNVVIDEQDVRWLGARAITNITAEVSALVVAQALSCALPCQIPIVIRPDLQLSKSLAELQVTLKEETVLCAMSASLSRLGKDNVSLEEVRAHRDHAWNELADCVAKHAAQRCVSAGRVPWQALHNLAQSHLERNWMWLQDASTTLQAAFPPLYDKAVMQFPHATTDTRPSVSPAPSFHSEATIRVKVCSLNVLALDDKESGYLGGRTIRLDHQMHGRGCDIICLQESRTIQGQRTTEHYQVYSGGGAGLKEKQFLGCEVWLHRTRALLTRHDGSLVRFRDFKVTVVVADERRLILHLSGPVQIVIASLHAPCFSKSNSMEVIERWWHDTAQMLRSFQGVDFVVGCDANAPLASCENRHHGLHGAEDMNDQGELFEQFLGLTDLVAPSTFPCHSGEQGTWKHPKGSLLRRDFVLVSAQLLAAVQHSVVVQDLDLGFSHVDHYPVECELAYVQATAQDQDKIRWDRKKMKDPKLCKLFQDDLRSLPIPRWDVDVDAHNQYFNKNVLALAAKHFQASPENTRARPQLSEPTRNLIAFKRQVLACLRHATGVEADEIKAELK